MSRARSASATPAAGTPARRLAVVLALGVVPWTVVVVGDRFTVLFAFGVVTLDPPALLDYLTLAARGWRLPRRPGLVFAAPALYLGAVASALAGLRWREDPRLTGGLLALSGLASLGVAWSVAHRLSYAPVPVGGVLLLGAAWWYYWPAVRP